MSTNLFDLTGKIALVTGASRGIDEEIAEPLAEQGAHMIVSSRKLTDCEIVAEHIREAGGKAEALACHVRRIEDTAATFDTIRRTYGRLDILINSAAASPHFDHILDTDLAAYEKTVEADIRGYLFMSVEIGKMMKVRGGDAVANTVLVNTLRPGGKQGIYSITKTTVAHITRASVKECGPFSIRVNTLLPRLTKTKFAGVLFEDKVTYDRWISKIPLHRHTEPREMAGTVLYLVSNATNYTNGGHIIVDGSMTV